MTDSGYITDEDVERIVGLLLPKAVGVPPDRAGLGRLLNGIVKREVKKATELEPLAADCNIVIPPKAHPDG